MSEATPNDFNDHDEYPTKFVGTPRRSANPPNGLDKTPRHAQGDIKSADTSSAQNVSPDSNGSSQLSQKTSRGHTLSPDADAVKAALLRCSRAAAERRRILTNNNHPASQPKHQSSLDCVGVLPVTYGVNSGFPSHAGFNPTAYGYNAGLPAGMLTPPSKRGQRQGQEHRSGGTIKSTRSSHSGRMSANRHSANNTDSPRQNGNYNFGYYRDLLIELNGMDNMVRWGSLDFVPTNARRLLMQEIQRLESYYNVEDQAMLMNPFHKVVTNQSSVLETIGRPPLRVPPAMLNRAQHSFNDASHQLTEESKEEVDDTSDEESEDESELSEITSVDCDTAVEPDDKDYLFLEDQIMKEPITPEQKKSLKLHSTPMGDVNGHSTPKSANHSNLHSSPNKTLSKLEPILEVNEIPELKVFVMDEIPDDLSQMRRLGIQPLQSQCAKIFIPEIEGYNFIGRIIGPRGISVRRLESETGCKILIRGQGSVKDNKREELLRNKDGWLHLKEKLHVLVVASDSEPAKCRQRLDSAVESVRRLLTPQYDEYKRQQLMQLAIINGTYRP